MAFRLVRPRALGHEPRHRRTLDVLAMGQMTEAFDVGRPAEEIALRLIAQFLLQELKFGLGLDALGEHRQAKSAAKAEVWG
jgi:hypothetical protein